MTSSRPVSRSPLLRALEDEAIWGPAPEAVGSFDASATVEHGDRPTPDFSETSPQVDRDRVHPWRLTHYFDVARRPLERRVGIAARLFSAADALAIAVPAKLADLLVNVTPEPALRQLCLGIDARDEPERTRLKLYAIFEGDASAYTRALCTALDVTPPEAADLSLTHIVGIDLDRAGLRDVKLYYAMDPRKVTRTLREPQLAIPLLRGCRRVVYQRSLIVAGKQSYHFHANAPNVLHAELERLHAHAPATEELMRRHEAMAKRGLAPWILAHSFAAGELDRRVYSLYLHLSS